MSRLYEATSLVRKELQVSRVPVRQVEAIDASDNEISEEERDEQDLVPQIVQQLLTLQQQQTQEIQLLKSSLWTEHKTQQLLMENARYMSMKREIPTARVTVLSSKRSTTSSHITRSVVSKTYAIKPKDKSPSVLKDPKKKPDFDISTNPNEPVLKTRSGLTSFNKKNIELKNAENLAIADLKLQKKAKDLELERLMKLNKELTMKKPKRLKVLPKLAKKKIDVSSIKNKPNVNELLRVKIQNHVAQSNQIKNAPCDEAIQVQELIPDGIDISIQCDLNVPLPDEDNDAPIVISETLNLGFSQIVSDMDKDLDSSMIDDVIDSLQEEICTIVHLENEKSILEKELKSASRILFVHEATEARINNSKNKFHDYMQVFLGFLNLSEPWKVLALIADEFLNELLLQECQLLNEISDELVHELIQKEFIQV